MIKRFPISSLGERGAIHRTAFELGRYALVGALSTSVDIGVYLILTRLALPQIDPVLAKSASFILGSVCSFLANRKLTFAIEERICATQVARFYAMVAVSFLANISVFYASHDIFGAHDLAAAAIALSFSFCAGFVISKLWVFRRRVF